MIMNNKLNEIKIIFNFDNSELASAIGIKINTLLHWFKEGVLFESSQHRVNELYLIAIDWSYNNLTIDKNVVIPLLQDHLDRDKTIFIGRRLKHNCYNNEENLL